MNINESGCPTQLVGAKNRRSNTRMWSRSRCLETY